MADEDSPDDSSGSFQANKTNGSSTEDAPTGDEKGYSKDGGLNKVEHKRGRTKHSTKHEDEQESPERSSSDRTYKSVKDKTKVNVKNSITKFPRSDKKNQQLEENRKTGHRKSRRNPTPSSDEFDHRNIKKSTSDQIKTKVADNKREKILRNIDPENRDSTSKPKHSKLSSSDYKRDKKRGNFDTKNHEIHDVSPKQSERINKKLRTSKAALESSDNETSESDSDTAKQVHNGGGGKRNIDSMASEGSQSSVKGKKSGSHSNNANDIGKSIVNKGTENLILSSKSRSRGKEKIKKYKTISTNSERTENKLHNSKNKRTAVERGDEVYGDTLHKGAKCSVGNVTESKDKSKKKEFSLRTVQDDSNSSCDRTSSRNSSCSSSAKNHDSSSSRSYSDRSSNFVSDSQNEHKGTAKRNKHKKPRKPTETKVTDCNIASNASRREGTVKKNLKNGSNTPHDTKKADEAIGKIDATQTLKISLEAKQCEIDCASNASIRESTSKTDAEYKSKKPSDTQKIDCDPSSYSSPSEGTDEWDSASDKLHETKDTDSERASNASRREVTDKEKSNHQSKISQETKEKDFKNINDDEATDRARRRNENDGIKKSALSLIEIKKWSSERMGMFLRRATSLFNKVPSPKALVDGEKNVIADRREGTENKNPGNTSKQSLDRKETNSDGATSSNRRDGPGKSNWDDNSKIPNNANVTNYKKKDEDGRTSRGRERYGKGVRPTSASSRSSYERRRSLSREKSRDKTKQLERGKQSSKRELRDEESRRNYYNDDYNNGKKNRDKKLADRLKKKSRESYRGKHRSRDRREESEHDWEMKSKDCLTDASKSYDDGQTKYRDSPKWKGGYRVIYDDENSYKKEKYEQPNYKYEWQFENEDGNWITYGESAAGKPLQEDNTVTSEDIEEFYSTHRCIKKPLLIETNNNKYALDFNTGIQTNIETSVCRRFRRVRKRDKHSYGSEKYNDGNRYGETGDNNFALSVFERVSGHRLEDDRPTGKNDPSTKFEWQFEDDVGDWVTYGNSNSARDRNTSSSTTSDEIEKFHARNPAEVTMKIRSGRSQYLLNFKQMTQMNNETLFQRRIRRVSKASKSVLLHELKQVWSTFISPGSSHREVETFEWQFQDEHSTWITYGQANSTGDAAFSTSATSDDIEKHYQSSHDKTPISISSQTNVYILDFKSMVQTNQKTLVQRPIRRVTKKVEG